MARARLVPPHPGWEIDRLGKTRGWYNATLFNSYFDAQMSGYQGIDWIDRRTYMEEFQYNDLGHGWKGRTFHDLSVMQKAIAALPKIDPNMRIEIVARGTPSVTSGPSFYEMEVSKSGRQMVAPKRVWRHVYNLGFASSYNPNRLKPGVLGRIFEYQLRVKGL